MTNERSRLLKAVRLAGAVLALLLAVVLAPAPTAAQVRIKDIASFEGVRDNLLVGYGLVVGLQRHRRQPLEFAVYPAVDHRHCSSGSASTSAARTSSRRTSPPSWSRPPCRRSRGEGSRIDVTVSAIGDAKSLQGGTLLVTPLSGADGQVYACQPGLRRHRRLQRRGRCRLRHQGYADQRPHRERRRDRARDPFALADLHQVRIALHNPDFTTASRMAEVINAKLGGPVARPPIPTTVSMTVPAEPRHRRGAPHHRRRASCAHPRPGLARRHRRAHRHHRHGRQCEHQHGGDLAGQPDRHASPRRRKSPSPNAFSQRGDTAVVPRTNVDVSEGGTGNIAIVGRRLAQRSRPGPQRARRHARAT